MENSTFLQGKDGQLEWVDIQSGSIASVAFNRNTRKLFVKFASGAIWEYENVSPRQYQSVQHSGSSGGYLRKEIIPHHAGRKVNTDSAS